MVRLSAVPGPCLDPVPCFTLTACCSGQTGLTRTQAIQDVNEAYFVIDVAGLCCGRVSHVLSTCAVLGTCTHVCAHLSISTHTLAQSLSCTHTEDDKNDMTIRHVANTHKQTWKCVGKKSSKTASL